MSKMVSLTLPCDIVDAILNECYDSLEVWRDTKEYLASGYVEASRAVAACSSVKKARRMIKIYEETISSIESKVGKKHCEPL